MCFLIGIDAAKLSGVCVLVLSPAFRAKIPRQVLIFRRPYGTVGGNVVHITEASYHLVSKVLLSTFLSEVKARVSPICGGAWSDLTNGLSSMLMNRMVRSVRWVSSSCRWELRTPWHCSCSWSLKQVCYLDWKCKQANWNPPTAGSAFIEWCTQRRLKSEDASTGN